MDKKTQQTKDDQADVTQTQEQEETTTDTSDVGGKGGYAGEDAQVDADQDDTSGQEEESDIDEFDAGTVV